MVYSTLHGNRTGTDQMESVVPCRNVHAGPRQDWGQAPLFPFVSVPFPVPVLITFPCSVNKPSLNYT